MGKRGAVAEAVAVKCAKMEHTDIADCPPVSALLADAEGLTDECCEMLRAIAPHCLGTPKADRHEYQNQMVDSLATIVTDVVSKHVAAVEAIQAEINEADASVEGLNARVPVAEAMEVAEREARDAKDAAANEAAKLVTIAKERVTAEQSRMDGHAAEVAAAEKEKESLEKVVSDVWAPLKAGIPGKEWRHRDKLIKALIEALGGDALPSSFASSLPVALKAKAEDRGSFATTTVEFAEGELKKMVAALAEKIGNSAEEATARSQAVDAAKASLIEALAAQDKAVEDQVAAENALSEAQQAAKDAREAVKAIGPSAAARSKKLEQSKAALAKVQMLEQQFAAFREQPRLGEAELAATAPDDAAVATV